MKGSRVRFLEESLSILKYEMAYEALKLVKKEMCKEKGFQRHNGTHYYFHLVDVTQRIINVGIRDENIVTAALLHDIVEDVEGYTIPIISDLFNPEVAFMVDLVTKKEEDDFKNFPERNIRYLDNIAQNLGAAVIKTSDRIHNVGTLLDATLEKRYRKAIETKKYYIPFFKKCRNLHPWYAAFFFDAKTIIEPQIQLIEENYEEVEKLKKEIEELKSKQKTI